MKRYLLLILLALMLSGLSLGYAVTVQIGNGYSHQQFPFHSYYGYGRSLGLYTAAQIGQFGKITSLDWFVHIRNLHNGFPYRIYIRSTSATQLTPMTWAEFTSGASMVKEGRHYFNNIYWTTFELDTPFYYTEGNLLIGVETNYGGNGTASSTPIFYYTGGTTASHQYWTQNQSAPTGNGTVDDKRPNVRITLTPYPPYPVLELEPTECDFGRRVIHFQNSKTFTITNIGSGTLNVTGISPMSSSFFTVTDAPTFPVALTTGQTTTFKIKYAPTAVGNHTATFTINHPDGSTSLTANGECYDPTISSFPYLQDFDGTWSGSPAAPEGWTVINADNDNYTWRQASSGHSTPYAAHGAGNVNDWLITPAINLNGIEARVRWWDKVTAGYFYNSYKVLVSTTTPDIASFTTELADIVCTNEDWTRHTLNLDAYTGQTIYLAFYQYASADSYWSFGIDDVLLEEIPTSPIFTYAPTDLDLSPIRANTVSAYKNVTVTNTAGGNLNLTEADVSIIGPGAAMFEFDPVNLPFDLAGDQSGSIPVRYNPTAIGEHSATLRMVYGGTNHDVALLGTAVGEYSLLESFEDEMFPPLGWGIHDGGEYHLWERFDFMPRTGEWHACLDWNSGTEPRDDWLITPQLAPSAEDHIFGFYGIGSSHEEEGDERFNVLVSTTTPDIASFTHTLATNVQTGTLDYMRHTFDLSNYIGQNIYVAIQAISQCYGSMLAIDDVFGVNIVPVVPSTPVLRSPVEAALATHRPTLAWDNSPGGIPRGYKVYCDTNNPPTTLVADVTDREYTFATDLLPETVYYWTVKAYNSAGISEAPTACSFITTPAGVVIVGEGNLIDTSAYWDSYPAPYGGYWKNAREQYIVTAAEFAALGAQAGDIKAIGFNVSDEYYCGGLPNFSISMGTTEFSEFVDYNFLTGLTPVYSVDEYTPVTGWNTHEFTTPFNWDGVSNVVIQVSFDMKASSTINATTYFSYTFNHKTMCYRSNNTDWDTVSTGYRLYYRPNMAVHFDVLPALEVQVSISGLNAVLAWESVPDAISYKVYASEDPYNFSPDPIATVDTNSYTTPLTTDKRFFRVSAVFGP